MNSLKQNLFSIFNYHFQASFRKTLESEIRNGGEFRRVKLPLKNMNSYIAQFASYVDGIPTEVTGLGVDLNESVAYEKAFVEFFERKTFFTKAVPLGFETTNGIAGHKFKSLARNNAMNELFERDSFLRHWYQEVPFNIEPTPSDNYINDVVNELEDQGHQTHFLSTYLGHKKTIVSIIQERESGGFVVGLASGQKSEFKKALDEAVINLFYGNGEMSRAQRIEKIKKDGIVGLRDHRGYWLYMNHLPDWVLSSHKIVEPSFVEPSGITFRDLYKDGVCISTCECDSCIPLIVGNLSENDIEHLNKIGIVRNKFSYHPIP